MLGSVYVDNGAEAARSVLDAWGGTDTARGYSVGLELCERGSDGGVDERRDAEDGDG